MVYSAVSQGLLFLVVCSTVLLSASPAVLAQPHPREVQAAGAWEVVPISETVSLYALDMISAADGWAGGTSGLALHYDGISWTDADTTFSDVFTAIDMVDAGFGFGTSYQGNILRYSGGQWSTVGQLATSSLTGISMIDANNGWAVGYLGGIYRYQNGSWWEWTNLPYLFQAIDMVSANEGWILGRTGVMLRWDGSTWQVVSTPQNLWFLDVDMVNSSDGWAVGYEGIIYRYDGSAWSPVSSPVPGITLWSVSMSSSSNGWAVGAGGTILRYDGSSWKIVDSPVTTELHAVDAVSDNEAWAVGKGGAVLHYLGTFDLASSSLAASTTHCSAGDAVGYTIRVRNTGSLSASQVVVTDPLPANTSYVAGSAQTTKGTIQGTDPLVVAVGDVGPGGEVTISFQVTAGDPGLACWFMSNQATITAAGADPIVRQAVTSVGSCLRIHLPLVVRGAGVR
jgi:uncharacterized repeat protein (TIGR01451 family)